MEIGDRVREIRHHLHMNQTDFAESLGTNRTVIKNLELNRSKKPENKMPLLLLMCRTYGFNEDWLITGEGDRREAYLTSLDFLVYDKAVPYDDVPVLVDLLCSEPHTRETLIRALRDRLDA